MEQTDRNSDPDKSDKIPIDEQIAQVLSHDLRAISRALVTLPIWLREELEEEMDHIPPKVGELLVMLGTQSARLDAMLRDLRTYQSIGTHDREGPVSLRSALESVLPSIEVPADFELTHHFDVAELTGAKTEISLLLAVLIDNAVTHGATALHLTSELEDEMIRINAQDNGPGVAPQFREKVFDLMTKLRSRDEVEGSGIGLAIAQRIAEVHGGTIHVESASAGAGACFVVRLPC